MGMGRIPAIKPRKPNADAARRRVTRQKPLFITGKFSRNRLGGGVKNQSGAMPLSASSLSAISDLDRCSSPMPRSTWGALVNWMFS